ncbi:hypothetical protein GCM10010267_61610 [Streptomyces griseorubens]|nr:hypothetical protein GCM10010267_61610 [Streptomyces griseorubens]
MLGHGRADAFAAAQAGRDEVEGVFAVHLGAGCAPGVAADEQLPGRKVTVNHLVHNAALCPMVMADFVLHLRQDVCEALD